MKKALGLTLLILTAWQAMSQSNESKDSSTGWIPIQIITGQLIFPITINGHPAMAHIVNELKPNYIDQDFIAKNNITYEATAPGQPKKTDLTLQIGALTVDHAMNAILIQHQVRNEPVDLIIGDDIFKEFIVDIDFPNQKIAFHRPGGFIPPKGVTPLDFKQDGDSRAASASIEGGPTMSYWVYLGDPAPVSIYQSYFTIHAMLKGRANSVRMGGGNRTPPEAIATVHEVHFAGASFSQVPGVFPDDSVTGDHPAEVAGHIGLGILSRCRIIFDYSHDRLYGIPGSALEIKAPFPKDRSGLVMYKIRDSYVVRFVCPGSPAMKAGFQIGDTITQVNDQPLPSFMGTAWQLAAWNGVRMTGTGTTYSFTIKDGTVRKLTTADFF